jgi:hypothetical protein
VALHTRTAILIYRSAEGLRNIAHPELVASAARSWWSSGDTELQRSPLDSLPQCAADDFTEFLRQLSLIGPNHLALH